MLPKSFPFTYSCAYGDIRIYSNFLILYTYIQLCTRGVVCTNKRILDFTNFITDNQSSMQN